MSKSRWEDCDRRPWTLPRASRVAPRAPCVRITTAYRKTCLNKAAAGVVTGSIWPDSLTSAAPFADHSPPAAIPRARPQHAAWSACRSSNDGYYVIDLLVLAPHLMMPIIPWRHYCPPRSPRRSGRCGRCNCWRDGLTRGCRDAQKEWEAAADPSCARHNLPRRTLRDDHRARHR